MKNVSFFFKFLYIIWNVLCNFMCLCISTIVYLYMIINTYICVLYIICTSLQGLVSFISTISEKIINFFLIILCPYRNIFTVKTDLFVTHYIVHWILTHGTLPASVSQIGEQKVWIAITHLIICCLNIGVLTWY